MGIISKIRNFLRANNKLEDSKIIYYLFKRDDYTGVVRYYKCRLDRENLHFEASMSLKEPRNVEISELDEFVKNFGFDDLVYKAISNANFNYEKSAKISNFFYRLEDLYRLGEKDKNANIANTWNKHLELIATLESKCKELGIKSETDTDKIYKNIIYEINKHEKKEAFKNGYSLDSYINFSYSKDKIDEEVNKALVDNNYNTRNFYYERMYLVSYFVSYIENLPICIELLNKNILTDEEKETLKKYLEFLRAIPKVVEIINYLDETYDRVEYKKSKKNKEKYQKNREFVDEINNLLSKSDTNFEDLFLHATTSLDSAKSIIDNGLYTFGSLDSFSMPLVDVDQIFMYQYGGALNKVGDYIIIFRLPKDNYDLEDISEKEQKEALGKIAMRRSSLLVYPSKKVNTSNILGIIDKKNMQVIINDKFIYLDKTKEK